MARSHSGPARLRLEHRASADTVGVQAVQAAVSCALHNNPEAWLAVRRNLDYPKFEVGRQVEVPVLAILLEFVATHIEHAAAESWKAADGANELGLDVRPRTRSEVVSGLSNFVLQARRWLSDIDHDEPAIVGVGQATIDDPSLPSWPPT